MLKRPWLAAMLSAATAVLAFASSPQAQEIDRHMTCQLSVSHAGTVDFEATVRAPALKFTMSDSGEVSRHNRVSLIYESALDNESREITLIPALAVESGVLVFKGFLANIKNLGTRQSLAGQYQDLPRFDAESAQVVYLARSSGSPSVTITLRAYCALSALSNNTQ